MKAHNTRATLDVQQRAELAAGAAMLTVRRVLAVLLALALLVPTIVLVFVWWLVARLCRFNVGAFLRTVAAMGQAPVAASAPVPSAPPAPPSAPPGQRADSGDVYVPEGHWVVSGGFRRH